MDLDRSFTIREASHRILDPLSPEKLATLGRALRLAPGMTVLDLACGKGELLCSWSAEHQITGTGVDISTVFLAAAEARAVELGVSGHVRFVHGDASTYEAAPVDVASCLGATWIGGGVAGTVELLERSLKPGGLVLIGEPYWRVEPPDEETARKSGGVIPAQFSTLPGLVERVGALGLDVVEMMASSEDDWDRYVAAQWLNLRRFLDEHPDDELAGDLRAELTTAPLDYVRYQRQYLGWVVLVLQRR